MALLSRDTYMSVDEICVWNLKTFGCYERLLCEVLRHTSESSGDMKRVRGDIRNSLAFDLPAEEVPADDGRVFFFISEAEAEEDLVNLLFTHVCPKCKSAFPFSELPTELRTHVFETILAYPSSGLRPLYWNDENKPRHGFELLSREFDLKFGHEKWDSHMNQDTPSEPFAVVTASLGEILSPLLISRRSYEEAVSIFYSVNRFYCPDLGSLRYFLGHLSPARREYVTLIAATLTDPWLPGFGFNAACEYLTQLGNLRTLDIRLDGNESWVPKLRNNVPHLPCLTSLLSIRIDEVNVEGCPGLASELNQSVVRSEADKEARSVEETQSDRVRSG